MVPTDRTLNYAFIIMWYCVGIMCLTVTSPVSAKEEIVSYPLKPRLANQPTKFTRLMPTATGVSFERRIYDNPLEELYSSAMSCGGTAIGDVNGDGLPDLYFASDPASDRLYFQTDPFKFENATEKAGVNLGQHWGVGATMADVDGDGDLDIYVCNYNAPNQLYINDGKGHFAEEAAKRGLAYADASHTAAFADYDNDGDLDLYLLNNRLTYPKKPTDQVAELHGTTVRVRKKYKRYFELTNVKPGNQLGSFDFEYKSTGRPDKLFRNDGKGHFTDVTQEAGIDSPYMGLSATWFDADNDGWTDLYIGNDFDGPDRFYHNNGDGTFTDILDEALPYTTWFSMGADIGDIDRDGRLDFIVADMSGTNHYKQKTSMGAMQDVSDALAQATTPQYMRNMVFLNRGRKFLEAGKLIGLDSTDWTWSARLLDLDNDGNLDAYFTNGFSRNFNESDDAIARDSRATQWQRHKHLPKLRERNLAFRNLGNYRFEQTSQSWGLDHLGVSYAAAHADLDRDGDLDLIVTNLDEPVSIYRNDGGEGHGVLIRLVGTTSNRWGIGAKVRIETAGGSQIRELGLVRGYLASNEPLVHFGLGSDAIIDQLEVTWPSGRVQRFESLAGDRHYVITEPEEQTTPKPRPTPIALFQQTQSSFTQAKHTETPFDDYSRQPLLPYALSQLGPGMAWGDVDGDGDEDLFVGGAAGHAGNLFENQGNGDFAPMLDTALTADAKYEDMGALFFDSDSDGDLDLYVVSGGVECRERDPRLRDRLYLNDGTGNLSRAPFGTLPLTVDSGSCVVGADFDRDGDIDLFVGSRSVVGKYPLPPRSRLFRNDKGRFSDITDQIDSLANAGMVTSAIWSDVDNDQWVDLLVTVDWGAIRLFKNHQGRLKDATESAGLLQATGWWNGISGGDLDQDGDTDFIVTNLGLNTKYHASQNKPLELYYGDFGKTGKSNIIEAEYEGNKKYPMRGKSCSSQAMPHLLKKFDSYHSFAIASLSEIYPKPELDQAYRVAATMLESVVLRNDGNGRFSIIPLPRLAQIAPGFGVAIGLLNADPYPDIIIAQNFYSPQVETGRMSGGLGACLLGKGDATFTVMSPEESGLWVSADAKSLTLTDVDGDLQPDLIFGVNNDSLQHYRHSTPTPYIAIQLEGRAGNTGAVGAKIHADFSDGSRQHAEIYAGGGYLSQSSTRQYFTPPKKSELRRVIIDWPDGKTTTHTSNGERLFKLKQPD